MNLYVCISKMAAKIDVNSSWYKDALEHTSAYNSRLSFERKQRSPFLDAQTGVAQVGCHLWKSKLVRRAPAYPYQLYSYPGRRWKKRPHKAPAEKPAVTSVEVPGTANESIQNPSTAPTTEVSNDLEETVESTEAVNIEGSEEESHSDSEDEEESVPGPRRPGRPGRPPKRPQANTMNFLNSKVNPSTLKVRNFTKEELAKMSYDERQKPYVCEICGKRYKNGPGLKYHYTHYNHEQDVSTSASETTELTPVNLQTSAVLTSPPFDSNTQYPVKPPVETPKEASDATITPNDYCDFCLGDVNENKKTLLSEELLSCADCGRSGHPTCLQFTVKLTNNVKKYRWQCIECKSCTLCGTSDNDDQLLFCDDCDRGYHMYCLKPPMETPPEGIWICKLCEEETNSVFECKIGLDEIL